MRAALSAVLAAAVVCGLASAAPWQRRSLRDIYLSYEEDPIVDRWLEYAEHYERHLPTPDGTTPVRLLEIGVQSGGSSRVWKQYYGNPLTYVGIDINHHAKRVESLAESILIEIGDQTDGNFLRSVCETHGPFDVAVDNGGHTADMMHYTLNALWNASATCLTASATYVMAACESSSPAYCKKPTDVTNVVANAFYGMHAHWRTDGALPLPAGASELSPAPPAWASEVRSISLYDSMAFFQRGPPVKKLTRLTRGFEYIPYSDSAPDTAADLRSRRPAPVKSSAAAVSTSSKALLPKPIADDESTADDESIEDVTVMSAALMANSPPIYCDPNNPARCTCNGVPIGPDTWTAPSWLESNSDLRSCLKPTALYDVLPELTVCSRVCSQRLPYTRPAPLSVVCPLHCQSSRQRQRCWSTLRPHEGCRT